MHCARDDGWPLQRCSAGWAALSLLGSAFAVVVRRVLIAALLAALLSPAVAAEGEHGDEHTISRSDVPADAPGFEQFAVKTIYRGAPARPDVHTASRSRLFRTMIRLGAKRGPNFAGHYTLVMWGCGSGCLAVCVVDAVTGKVFHPENLSTIDNENVDWEGLEGPDGRLIRFRLDSRLIVVPGGINEDPQLRGISYFVWERQSLRRIRFVAKPYE